jgi:hypothetical protein
MSIDDRMVLYVPLTFIQNPVEPSSSRGDLIECFGERCQSFGQQNPGSLIAAVRPPFVIGIIDVAVPAQANGVAHSVLSHHSNFASDQVLSLAVKITR